jgi:predicted aspartyl protease
MRRALIAGFSLSVLIAGLPGPGYAQIFRYTDERGQNHYVDGLENIPERHRATATPLGLRNAPTPTPTSAPTAARSAGTTVIKYTPGQRVMVDVKINGGFSAQLLLDTGADRTMISPRTLQAAGVAISRPVATGTITGVTGTDRLDYVVVDSLEIGEARVGRMPVGSYELAGTGAGDGLLGRDFLDQFKVTFGSAKGEVHLAPK